MWGNFGMSWEEVKDAKEGYVRIRKGNDRGSLSGKMSKANDDPTAKGYIELNKEDLGANGAAPHNHNEYAPKTHKHDDKADVNHTHDTTHTHNEFAASGHTHPPQDLTHNHDGEYADAQALADHLDNHPEADPYNDTQIREDFAAADQNLQDQIDVINTSGYNDTELRGLIAGNTDALDDKSDKTHTHDTTHNHDGEYLTSDDLPEPYDDSELKGRVSTDEGNISALQAEQATQDAAIKENKDAIEAIVIPDVSDFTTKDYVDAAAAEKLGKGSTTYVDAKAIEDDIAGIESSISDLADNYDQLVIDLGNAGGDLTVELAGYLKKGSASYADAAGIEAEIDQEKNNRADGDASTLASSKTYTDEEIAKIPATDVSSLATKDELTTGLSGKSDTDHTHDTTHNHDDEYQAKGDYAAGDHSHPPQDLTHDHDAQYAAGDHTHPPQDLTHTHNEYQAAGNYVLGEGATGLAMWIGTQEEYDAIPNKRLTTLYVVM